MERETILEYLRIVLIAFVIAVVINFVRVAITGWQNGNRLGNNTEQEAAPSERIQHNAHSRDNTEIIKQFNSHELDEEGRIQIPLSPRINLSGKSKNEIFELRKQAVKSSPIFNNDYYYEPNLNVFKISDNKPWISASSSLRWSKATNNEKTDGPSRDSLGILNPELLYYIALSEYDDTNKTWIHFYKPSLFVPYKVFYKPETKTISAYITNEKNQNGNYEPIYLADTNAHDLGYNYAYMNIHKNIGFYNSHQNNSLALGIKPITGYYMHGPACGIEGGCNNYAPYWQYYNEFYIKALPAKINIKLWKHNPSSVEEQADINFEMIFE